MKALTLFAGFGGVDLTLREVGFRVLGVENNPAIADVNRRNGGDVLMADVLDIEPENYISYDLIHASPPCPNFSMAKAGGQETDLDVGLAEQISKFIEVCKPHFFTLENVWLYRKSKSWTIILKALKRMGYGVGWWRLNSADYGVPQTRHRMIVVARRDGQRSQKPFPTHAKTPDMFTVRWRGWYEAIKDLIPALPETHLAPWQLRSLKKLGWFQETFLLGQGQRSNPKSYNFPADTITVNTNQIGGIKAYLVPVQGENSGPIDALLPSPVITTAHNSHKYRAFICDSQNTSKRNISRLADEPYFTVVSNSLEKNSSPKAFIVGGQYQAYYCTPDRVVQHRVCDSPDWTIAASDHLDTKVYYCSRVVAMTPRCLARFQDFPDWFQLPDQRTLACRGIGNALPPGMYRAVLREIFNGGINNESEEPEKK